ncbi:glucosamine--fructose-6-phosphate aminotransferase (isomerizing) [Nocardioides soli]|uniref:Glucosamine--fructose-6-phosphate aminotransferase (Isomerizing) n=2 Tax=Nocardioides soli TaxID=1036020 RepID=A0A7W4Z272_9ACTN|nr:glucosamine--fructose-6-phosphate aminotransferase (isomerizing) [Nocardioides soli]
MTTMMREEILEQPAAIARTVAALRPRTDDVRRLAVGRRQVLFAARGSSDNAATYGRYLTEIVAGRAAAALAPSVATAYRRRVDLGHALVVCLSQSGETAELVETLAWARTCGAATVAVTNVGDSALARGADLALVTAAGPERAIPATKTFTAQLVAMALLADALAPTPGAVRGIERVPDAVAELVRGRSGIERAVDVLLGRPRTLVTGRGLGYAVAAELALKLEETCLRPVPGLSYADLRHGPIAIVDDRVAAIVVAPRDGPVLAGLTGLVPELRSRGAAVVGIGLAAGVDAHVAGPDLPEILAPIGLVAAGQLVVEGLARGLGLDPDAPRGLRKVTQTDPEEAG